MLRLIRIGYSKVKTSPNFVFVNLTQDRHRSTPSTVLFIQ